MSDTKVSEFVGRASGDCECFCFDRRTREQSEYDGTLTTRTQITRDRLNRIYPHDLLPDWNEKRMGTWRITVEFTPVPDSTEATTGNESKGKADG